MTYPLVRDLAVDGVPVAVTCRVLKIARQPYYRWLDNPVTAREVRQAYLANALFDAHRDDPEFGHRLLADKAAAAGLVACDRTVWRICRDNAWWSVFGKARAKNGKKPGPPAHDDLVRRQFRADGPNRVWLWDIPPQAGGAPTEHPTGEGKLYLCAIKDVYSGRIVGYSISDRMKSRIAMNALASAVQRRGEVAGCIVHADRGSQFRSRKVLRELHRHALVGSMGQVASAGDNAATENFFALLQKNVLNRRRWATRAELRLAIITWIERTYHRRKRQTRLGRMTPIEYETITTTQAALTARARLSPIRAADPTDPGPTTGPQSRTGTATALLAPNNDEEATQTGGLLGDRAYSPPEPADSLCPRVRVSLTRWRWRESNPRPMTKNQGFSGCSPQLIFSAPTITRTSGGRAQSPWSPRSPDDVGYEQWLSR